jgi:hypothetical protein
MNDENGESLGGTREQRARFFADVDRGVRNIFSEVKNRYPETDWGLTGELIEANEWGIALELICDTIFAEKVRISKELFERIASAARQMKLAPERCNRLSKLTLGGLGDG